MSVYRLVSFLFLLYLLSGCKKSTYSTSEFIRATDYFPLETGAYVDFEAISIEHSPLTGNTILSDTTFFYVRYQVGDTLTDNLGNNVHRFFVKRKDSMGESWSTSDVWTAGYINDNCELVEENQRIVKLISPVRSSSTWNPNVFNTLPESESEYKDINKFFSINSLNFDSTITVLQCDERNLIRFCKKKEFYAKHIGLIYKYYKDLEISNFDTLNIRSGSEFYLTPIAYGIE